MLSRALSTVTSIINSSLDDYSPAEVVYLTLGSVLFLQQSYRAYQLYQQWDTKKIVERTSDYLLLKALSLPYAGKKIQNLIDREIHDALDGLKKEVDEFDKKSIPLPLTLPKKAQSPEQILNVFKQLPSGDLDWKKSGAVYVHVQEQVKKLLSQVSESTNFTNPMHPHWLLLNRMEGSVSSMCKNLFHGPEGTYGIITNGGTTSILEACKSHVFYAKKVRFIKNPEIIVPDTEHTAFDKAAEILGITVKKAPVDIQTGKVNIQAVESLITKKTCLIVGSAPSYPYGVFDDIEALGQLGLKHGIPVMVDACLGGFLSPHLEGLPRWDFSAPGVKTIAADIHKFGKSPKGISLVLFHPDCKASPTYTNYKTACGMYVTKGINGSYNGRDIAEAFTTLLINGEENYRREAKKIEATKNHLYSILKNIDGIQINFPEHAIIAIRTEKNINIGVVAEQFQKRGWSVNMVDHGRAFHFCVTSVHADTIEFINNFKKDITKAIHYAKAHPHEKPSGMIKAYGHVTTSYAPPYVTNMTGDFYSKIRSMHGIIPGFSDTEPPRGRLTRK